MAALAKTRVFSQVAPPPVPMNEATESRGRRDDDDDNKEDAANSVEAPAVFDLVVHDSTTRAAQDRVWEIKPEKMSIGRRSVISKVALVQAANKSTLFLDVEMGGSHAHCNSTLNTRTGQRSILTLAPGSDIFLPEERMIYLRPVDESPSVLADLIEYASGFEPEQLSDDIHRNSKEVLLEPTHPVAVYTKAYKEKMTIGDAQAALEGSSGRVSMVPSEFDKFRAQLTDLKNKANAQLHPFQFDVRRTDGRAFPDVHVKGSAVENKTAEPVQLMMKLRVYTEPLVSS